MEPRSQELASPLSARPVIIPERMYFTIGDVAELVDVKPHVLRYWESQFSILTPEKSKSQRRLYRRSDVEGVLLIKHLLYDRKFSIEGAKKHIGELRRQGELGKARRTRVALDESQVANVEAAKAEIKEILLLCE